MPVLRTELAVLLSLAACEHPDPVRADPPAAAPSPAISSSGAPSATSGPSAISATAATVDAGRSPAAIRTAVPSPSEAELDRRCMSRAGCRWKGEKTGPRVVKKGAPSSAAGPAK